MERPRVKAKSENRPKIPNQPKIPAKTPSSTSKFDDAEYARWSEQLSARSKTK